MTGMLRFRRWQESPLPILADHRTRNRPRPRFRTPAGLGARRDPAGARGVTGKNGNGSAKALYRLRGQHVELANADWKEYR
jgi:hypothetical protein